MITKRTFTYEEETSNTDPSPDDRQPELAKATPPDGQRCTIYALQGDIPVGEEWDIKIRERVGPQYQSQAE
jgi:hypothetical protein